MKPRPDGVPLPRGNLPVELTSFVGREIELARLREGVGDSRLLTLTGPGGVGKSRLALHLGLSTIRSQADGVWLVELATLSDPQLVPHAVMESLGINEKPGRKALDTLVEQLRDRQLLILLDNCEHLLEPAARLAHALISSCPRVRILATSRQPLDISGEIVMALPPLDAEADAVSLFANRAAAASAGFRVTAANRGAIVEVCRRLDGMPLAIELAAVRVRTMKPEDIVGRLSDAFSLLTTGDRSGLARHRALGAAFDWSHNLLGEDERVLWRRVSVFVGTAPLDAIDAVCGGGALPAGRIADALAGLVDKSILLFDPGLAGPTRYRILEPIRQYGRRLLEAAGESEELAGKHRRWCLQLTSGSETPWWASGRQPEALDRLVADQGNLRAALEGALASPDAATEGLRMANDLWLFWIIRGRYSEAEHHYLRLLTAVPEGDPRRVHTLWALGFVKQAMLDSERALACTTESARLAEERGDRHGLMCALSVGGTVLLRLGRTADAIHDLERSLELPVDPDDAFFRSLSGFFLAGILATGGDLEAAEHAAGAAVLASPAGEHFALGNLKSMLGHIACHKGDVVRAREQFVSALLLQRRIGHRWGAANSLGGLAIARALGRDFERAARLLGASGALWQEMGTSSWAFLQSRREACEVDVRRALGSRRYEAAYVAGSQLGWDESLAEALDEPSAPQKHEEDSSPLTRRELEIARLVATGLSNPEIGAMLFISPRTVATHVENILNKLGFDSRVQVAGWLAKQER